MKGKQRQLRTEDEYRRILRMMEVIREMNLRIERESLEERWRREREVEAAIYEIAK